MRTYIVLHAITFAVIAFLVIASYIENDDSSIIGLLTCGLILVLALFFISVNVVIPNEVEKARKETSWKCQFEECPYTYTVEQDTVLAK